MIDKTAMKREYFSYMNRVWSVPFGMRDKLFALVENDQPFDLYDFGARELRQRPGGRIVPALTGRKLTLRQI